MCVNDPRETVKDFLGNEVSLWNFVTSMSVETGVDDREEFKKAGFTEATLDKDPDSGQFIIPWFLKLGIPGKWSGRTEYVFQTVELLIQKTYEVWNGEELVPANLIESTGTHGLAYFFGSLVFYRFLQ